MNKKRRLVGIDLLKGIAAYAVVFIHSLGGPFGNTGFWAEKIGIFFTGFAVPFFLATSFYLMTQKIYFSNSHYSLKSRLKILITPYLIWTLIYLSFRAIKYLIIGDYRKFNSLFSDPVSIFFFGGAAVQLYFIPLLITGTIACYFITIFLLKKKSIMELSVSSLIVSTLIYEIVLDSNNAFVLGMDVAFNNLMSITLPPLKSNQFIRLALVELSWLLRCLPYIFVSIIFQLSLFKRNILKSEYSIIFFGLAFVINTLSASGNPILPIFVSEVCVAYFYLMFSLSLSEQITGNSLTKSLGVCSFGIYLVHHLLIDLVRPIVYSVYPGSITTMTVSICSIISFLLSWVIVIFLRKNVKLCNLLFGG